MKYLIIWIAIVIAIHIFFFYMINKIIEFYEEEQNERYKSKKRSR